MKVKTTNDSQCTTAYFPDLIYLLDKSKTVKNLLKSVFLSSKALGNVNNSTQSIESVKLTTKFT